MYTFNRHSSIYLSIEYTFFVPRSDLNQRWSTIFRVFHKTTWICLFLALVSTSIVLKILYKHQIPQNKSVHEVLKIWSLLLNMGINIPENGILRIVFFSWLLFSLCINTVFQTYVTSYFMDPGRQHQIDTVDELVDLDYQFVFDNQIPYLHVNYVKRFNERSYVHAEYCSICVIEHAFLTPKTALFMNDDELKILKTRSCVRDLPDLYKFKKVILEIPVYMLVLPPLLQKSLNRLVSRLTEAGLPAKFTRDYINPKGIQIFDDPLKGEYSQMDLQILQSPFILLVFGLAVSSIVFICELISAHVKILKFLHGKSN
ncbi:hypothetical protein L9F63_014204 [Diploptera punctata]|uniref:Ionotropic glutamate receptor C-terminal domain-containing protein n=1 Tax=Diploptera punctata TaxID=6984 RepID=A0AAD8A9R4_DIPPU|nr:hypothetical protein L9F63_014204 [Diploptera punctata]